MWVGERPLPRVIFRDCKRLVRELKRSIDPLLRECQALVPPAQPGVIGTRVQGRPRRHLLARHQIAGQALEIDQNLFCRRMTRQAVFRARLIDDFFVLRWHIGIEPQRRGQGLLVAADSSSPNQHAH